MEPYVIRQGDFLESLAYQFGFDADTVWNDPKNADLRQLRTNPNILYPTDVLYIPSQSGPPQMTTLATGSTNSFVANSPSVPITISFSDTAFASQSYSIQELPDLTGLATDASGTATFSAPVTLSTATISFADSGTTFAIDIGTLDPIDTLSGISQRLQHLGFIDDANVDPTNLDTLRAALRALTATQPGADLLPIEPPPVSIPPPSDSEPSNSSPPSNDPQEDPASTSDASPPTDGSAAPSYAPAPQDNAGLTDDGTLDDATSARLLAAHGS